MTNPTQNFRVAELCLDAIDGLIFTPDTIGTKNGNIHNDVLRSSESAQAPSEMKDLVEVGLTDALGYAIALDKAKVTKYKVGDKMTWHTDSLVNEHHIGTAIVLLNPGEFTGGELQILDVSDDALTDWGIFLPLGTQHQVTEITSGERLVFRAAVMTVGWSTEPLSIAKAADVDDYANTLHAQRLSLEAQLANIEKLERAHADAELSVEFLENLYRYVGYILYESYPTDVTLEYLRGVDRHVHQFLFDEGYKVRLVKCSVSILIDKSFQNEYETIWIRDPEDAKLVFLTVPGTSRVPDTLDIDSEYNDETYDTVATGRVWVLEYAKDE
jgi:hypothetical protein